MTVDAFLASTREWVDAALERWLPPASEEPRQLHAAMRYALFAGGKRLRPAIARAACAAAGGAADDALPAACALEMLHTYSLIHDDLPAIDNDDLRRGLPTCHRRFGEATAILAGDALQTHAFLVLAREVRSATRSRALVLALAEAAGTAGMVGGEIADIDAEGKTPDRTTVEFIHGRKTAALFRASAVMGGISGGAGGGAGGGLLDAFAAYGTALGLAFQIVDDVLDETGDAVTLGKSPGKDRAARKMSYPAAVGIDGSLAEARRLADEAQAAVAGLGDPAMLAALAELTVTRIR